MSPTRKRLFQAASAFAVLLLVLAVIGYRKLEPQAFVGAGFVAHQICSCVFVAERSYESCLPDLVPEMDAIRSEIIEVTGQSGARGWVPLLADRVAVHSPGFGCALD